MGDVSLKKRFRVFSIWRKSFIHKNKTRDNHALELGKRYDLLLIVRSSKEVGSHVKKSGAKIIEVNDNYPFIGVFVFYIVSLYIFWKENRKSDFHLFYSFLGEEPIGWFATTFLSKNTKWLVDLWDDPELIATQNYTIKQYIVKAYLYFLRKNIKRADIVVAGILPYSLDKYEIASNKLIKTTNGINIGLFKPEDHNIANTIYGNKSINILYVGHLMKDRGMDVLLSAINLLRASEEFSFTLTLVGFPDEIHPEWLQETISKYKLSKIVNNIGELSSVEVPMMIERADICIHPFPDRPGLAEIYPIKIYEYLAMNKAVVASDLPGVRTIIKGGFNGLLFESGSPESLAEKIHLLCTNPIKSGTDIACNFQPRRG